jgi:dCMP deaminase
VRPTWDETWLSVAEVLGARSVCDRRRVGAVITTPDNQVVSASYNGPPAGQVLETLTAGCLTWCPRAQRLGATDPEIDDDTVMSYVNCPSIHAEANALLRADRSRCAGGSLYVTSAICMDCAKLVANSGLARVVSRVQPGDQHRQPLQVAAYLRLVGLTVILHHDNHREGDT